VGWVKLQPQSEAFAQQQSGVRRDGATDREGFRREDGNPHADAVGLRHGQDAQRPRTEGFATIISMDDHIFGRRFACYTILLYSPRIHKE